MLKSITYIALLSVLFLSACDDDDVSENQKAEWITNAFTSLESGHYPRIKAIAWWHEDFDNSELTVNSSPQSLDAYQNGIKSSIFITDAIFENNKLTAPASGMYHAAYPDFGGTEDVVTADKITDFEQLAGKDIVWAYFSNNWYDAIKFPANNVQIISNAGKIPFIRLMPRTNFDEGGPDPNYTMQKIIDGVFDADLEQWAKDAADTGIPLLAEFGTEVNGNWFPWNGEYNGAGETSEYGNPDLPDGAERFQDAYRHIIDICHAQGAENITWFFHVDAYSEPDIDWNKIENYYPGDDYIDWLGVSIYGPQEPDAEYQEFSEIMDDIYPDLANLSDKPIAVLEFAVTELNE